MKIAVTGHSRGIGKAILDKFSYENYDVLGFSKSSGFDISNEEDRIRILSLAKDSDIFVNNAYDDVGQSDLLKKFINEWEGTNKLIVNISSKLAFCSSEFFPKFEKYIEVKKEQNKIIENRAIVDSPKILNVVIGLVNTDMANIFESTKLNPDDVADLIFTVLQVGNKISVQQLVIDVPGLDWRTIKIN